MSLVLLWFGILLALVVWMFGNYWLLIGTAIFWVGAALLEWFERIEARVVANLSKTCMCPLCVANREPPDGDSNQ